MIINGIDIDLNKTNIMGILNVTPDSFSDGGSFCELDKALFHCEQMLKDGAAVIDIGGESTRPGYTPVSIEEEINRVVPVIEGIKSRFQTVISLDTMKSEVALAGIKAGADIINDVSGLMQGDDMDRVVAEQGAYYILMHNKKTEVQNVKQDAAELDKSYLTIKSEMQKIIDKALANGVSADKLIIDPGVGFAKTKEEDLVCIRRLSDFKELGYPVLLGCSRKSCIGYVLENKIEERMVGTLATTAMAVNAGISFVRVHDVKENADFIKMYERLLNI